MGYAKVSLIVGVLAWYVLLVMQDWRNIHEFSDDKRFRLRYLELD